MNETVGWKRKKMSPKGKLLAQIRAAKTSANNTHGMGGLPKGGGHKPKPITLPKTPWDEKSS